MGARFLVGDHCFQAPGQDHRRFHSRAGGLGLLAPLHDVHVAEAELCDGGCLALGHDLYTKDLVASRRVQVD